MEYKVRRERGAQLLPFLFLEAVLFGPPPPRPHFRAAPLPWGGSAERLVKAGSSNPSEGKRLWPHARSRCGWREAKRLLTKGNGPRSRVASCGGGRIPAFPSPLAGREGSLALRLREHRRPHRLLSVVGVLGSVCCAQRCAR